MRLIRFLLRLIGTCLMAAGFVAFIIDGTRSIADGRLYLTRFGDALAGVDPTLEPALGSAVQTLASWLWDPATLWVLAQPASAVLALLGALLVLMGRRPRRRSSSLSYA